VVEVCALLALPICPEAVARTVLLMPYNATLALCVADRRLKGPRQGLETMNTYEWAKTLVKGQLTVPSVGVAQGIGP